MTSADPQVLEGGAPTSHKPLTVSSEVQEEDSTSSRISIKCVLAVGAMFALNIAIGNSTKAIYMHQGFDYPIFLTGLHMLFSWGATALFMQLRSTPLPSLSGSQLLSIIGPLSACSALSVALGNLSIKYIYPSFAQMLATSSPLAVMVLQVLFTRTRFNFPTYVSITIVTIGLILCSLREMNFHILGVVFSIASTLLRGGKTILQKRLLSSEDQATGKEGSQVVPTISSVALLNLMAPQCLAILFVASCSMEGLEPWDRLLFSESSEVTLHLWILFNCLNACLLNLSNFITASFVSPLTLQLLGNVKTVLGIFISALIFGNAVTPAQAAGCGAAVGGVYVYQRFGRSYERTSNHSVTKTTSADSMETSTPHITTDGLRPV